MRNSRYQQAFLQRVGVLPLLQLFDLMPEVSFFLKDRQGCFVALNRRGCAYCGVKSEREAWGKTDRDFFPRARAEEYIRDDQAVMRSGKPILDRVESAPESEGSPHLVVTSKIPLRDARGKVVGVAGFSRRVEQLRQRTNATERFAEVIRAIHERHGEEITSRELAKLVGLSVSQFDRVFRKTFGVSPRQYLLRVRVEAACRLLAESDETIVAIAIRCGFYDHAHFTRAFRQFMNESPSQYRREQRSL
jgi:AraC-like DNA-binding protein